MARGARKSGEAHPYVGLFKDSAVRTLWAGWALSDAGGELYRLGAICRTDSSRRSFWADRRRYPFR
jgi:hypothetical protein